MMSFVEKDSCGACRLWSEAVAMGNFALARVRANPPFFDFCLHLFTI